MYYNQWFFKSALMEKFADIKTEEENLTILEVHSLMPGILSLVEQVSQLN